jgi:DNA-binding winged helix-turn-helix (wHTH) protein
VLRFAGFELDPQRAELRGPDGETIRLRPKSFDMLQLFVANAQRVLSKQDLIEAIWPNVHVGEDSLFQCVREIRTALGDDRRQLIRLVSAAVICSRPRCRASPKALPLKWNRRAANPSRELSPR